MIQFYGFIRWFGLGVLALSLVSTVGSACPACKMMMDMDTNGLMNVLDEQTSLQPGEKRYLLRVSSWKSPTQSSQLDAQLRRVPWIRSVQLNEARKACEFIGKAQDSDLQALKKILTNEGFEVEALTVQPN